MGSTRALVALFAGAVGLAAAEVGAQERAELRAQVFPLGSLERFEMSVMGPDTVDAAKRCERLLATILAPRGKPARVQLTNGGRVIGAGGKVLLVLGDDAMFATAKDALAQLAAETPPVAQLQCSLLTLPAAVAAKLRPATGVVAPTDEAAWTTLVREAVKAGGRLHNLPELEGAPLRPFAAEVGKGAGAPLAGLRLRGEVLPLGAREFAIGLQLTDQPLPADVTQLPTAALLQPVLRLEAGKAAMVATTQGEVTTVLMVRCAMREPAAGAPVPAPAPPAPPAPPAAPGRR